MALSQKPTPIGLGETSNIPYLHGNLHMLLAPLPYEDTWERGMTSRGFNFTWELFCE